jgi:hypothetical protein
VDAATETNEEAPLNRSHGAMHIPIPVKPERFFHAQKPDFK